MSTTDRLILPEDFDPTFTGTRNEKRWIQGALAELYSDLWFEDVLYRVKGGKEATVYCLSGHESSGQGLIAAKVFRPRRFRAMRNDSLYKQGRGLMDGEGKLILDRRSTTALQKGTNYGRRLDTMAWVMHEYKALEELHEAGADVPKPLISAAHAILMEYVGDEDGAAPILQRVSLPREEAQRAFDRLIENLEIMLQCYRVHADLSAYNILYWEGELRIIDLPQAVDAHRHPDAFGLFSRDVDRICRYFDRQGLHTDPVGLAHDLWREWIA